MKKLIMAMAVCSLLVLGVANQSASAQAAQSADKTAPTYDMKAQSIFDLQDLQKKFVGLAEAIPADKYTWRPAPDVRSISEVYLHVAAGNYGILHMMGAEVPAGVDNKNMEKSTTDKAKVVAELNKSFTNAIAVVSAMTNAEFAKPQTKLGPDANSGDVIYLLVTHLHEHLGQAIANARANGIVPPWTVEAQKAAEAKKKADAAKQ